MLKIILLALSALGISANQAYARPAACKINEHCFQIQYTTYGNCVPGPVLGNTATGTPYYAIDVNGALVQTFQNLKSANYAEFGGSFLGSRIFRDGMNRISFRFGSNCEDGDVRAVLSLYPPHDYHAKQLLTQSIRMGEQILELAVAEKDLSELDAELNRQILRTKSEIQGLQKTLESDRVFFEQLGAQINALTAKLNLLNAELENLDFNDFETIDLSKLSRLIEEDPSIQSKFEDLHKSVEQLRREVENEILASSQNIQDTLEQLKTEFRQADQDIAFEPFNPKTLNTDPLEGLLSPPVIDGTYGMAYQEIAERTLQRLEIAIQLGRQSQFLNLVERWEQGQQQIFESLRVSLAPASELLIAEKHRANVAAFIRNQIDEFGFFKNTTVPKEAKQSVQLFKKVLDEKAAARLSMELNSWRKNLNSRQQQVLSKVTDLKDITEKFQNLSPNATAIQEQAKLLAKDTLSESVSVLADAAIFADLERSAQEFQDLQDSIQAGLSLARALMDLALSFNPVTSFGKDAYEAITGHSLDSEAELSTLDRSLAILGTCTGGASTGVLKSIRWIEKSSHRLIQRGVGFIKRGSPAAFREAERIGESAGKHGIKIVIGASATKVDKVILETLEGNGQLTSRFKLSSTEALDAGKKWVGDGYIERATGKGVFVSRDGLRQFRIDNGSITGAHSPGIPHVHLEEIIPETGKFRINNHIPFGD